MTKYVLVINNGQKNSQDVVKFLRDHNIYSLLISEKELHLYLNKQGVIIFGNKKLDTDVPVLKILNEENVENKVIDFINKHTFEKMNLNDFVEETILSIRNLVKDHKVILGLSGGVDSSVLAALLSKSIGKNLTCILVDHGFLRKGEVNEVKTFFTEHFDLNLVIVDAQERFLNALKGIKDPEEKRKIIGNEFIKVFEEEKNKIQGAQYLAQGTIYADIIESGIKGSSVIKSHHNVGGLPSYMNLQLIEPLKYMFKNEVRKIGEILSLPNELIHRQPFPGPGLAIRILGEITKEKLDLLKESDYIFRDEIKKAGLESKIWQYFTVLTPLKTVGIKDGKRTYDDVLVIRAVNSIDGMSAQIYPFEFTLLNKIVSRITTELNGISRIVYDITPKPTGTIEWE